MVTASMLDGRPQHSSPQTAGGRHSGYIQLFYEACDQIHMIVSDSLQGYMTS